MGGGWSISGRPREGGSCGHFRITLSRACFGTREGGIRRYEEAGGAWWSSREEDRDGNAIEYHYRNEPGEVVPDSIDYVDGARRVVFDGKTANELNGGST